VPSENKFAVAARGSGKFVEDLDAKLPLLATYLGHQHLSGTQRYLHLSAEIFPEITARVNAAFGDVIPRRIQQ